VAGRAHESLAGAINRYARSRQRLKLEEDEREYQEEQAFSDNFDELKNTVKRGHEVVAECEGLLVLPDLDQLARSLLNLRKKRAQQEIDAAKVTYGPRQYYLSEFTSAQLTELGVENIENLFEKIDVEIGNLRRSGKSRVKTG
jgi:hypothetical protein